MGQNIEKFRKICKEKGIFNALFKTISYLVFLRRKNRLEKMWRPASLKSGRLEIKGWNTGPKIFWDGLELTKSTGLNTSIFVNGKWQDSSRADWKMKDATSSSLSLENTWSSLSIKQNWIISNLGDGKFSCDIKLETPKDIEFIEQKFTIMVSEKLNLWFDDFTSEAFFPQFKDWVDIKEVKKDSLFIGAQSNIDKGLPRVIVRKLDTESRVYSQIQNSNFKTKARLLNLVASSRDMDLKYKKGISPFFKMEIDVK